MTLALYARGKQWPLQAVTVKLEHSKIHAQDCAECETKEGKLDRIDREIELEGVLSDEAPLPGDDYVSCSTALSKANMYPVA